MLVSLLVKNFAIIDNAQIDFSNGMTVITGETGAGKSLIIDAISLLLGKRAQNDLIRYGENKASITGVFSNYSDEIISYLDDFGISYDVNDNLIIKRELYANGKSICKINNEIITLNELSKIGDLIGDIHSQIDTFGLINPKNYLSFIRSKEIDKLVEEYKIKLDEYKKLESSYNNKIKENDEIKLKADFIKYQYNELKQASLNENEEKELKDEENYLLNYNKLLENINGFKEIYDDKNALDLIYESLSYLNKLKEYDNRYNDLYNNLEEAYYNIEEIKDNPLFKTSNFEYDENRLNEIELRLSLYSDLKRKYKKNTLELVEYTNKLKEELELVDNFDDIIKKLKKELDDKYQYLFILAKNIRNLRIEKSKELEHKLIENLNDLELKNTNFNIKFNEIDENKINFLKDGIDTIDFLVSFNKGENLKSLSHVASGGELSRFMLALKVILTDYLPQQTKIFDEIDSGVSGAVAFSIGNKIKNISKTSQVLCITHLPQVASLGDVHLKISKEVKEGRTFTVIETLEKDARVKELASMISNGNITDNSINLAKELLESGE